MQQQDACGTEGEAKGIKQAGEDTKKRPSVLPLKEKRVYEWGGMAYGQAKAGLLQS